MANEFKIKNALQILQTQPVSGISDSSSFTDDSSTLATINAIKNYAEKNFVPKYGGIFTGDVSVTADVIVTGNIYADQINGHSSNDQVGIAQIDINFDSILTKDGSSNVALKSTTNAGEIGVYSDVLGLWNINGITAFSPGAIAISSSEGLLFKGDTSIYSPARYQYHYSSPDDLQIVDASYVNWKVDACIGGATDKTYVDGSLAARDTSIAWLDANKLESSDLSGYALTTYVDGSLALRDGSIAWLDTNKLNTSGGTISGNLDIGGNLTINGSLYVIGVEEIDVSSAYIHMNTGLTGSPPSTLQSGMIIGRGTADPYAILFDETYEQFRVGITNWNGTQYDDASTQAVATRENTPTSGGVSFWNSTESRLDTSTSFTYESVGKTIRNGSLKMTGSTESIFSLNNESFLGAFTSGTVLQYVGGAGTNLTLDSTKLISAADYVNFGHNAAGTYFNIRDEKASVSDTTFNVYDASGNSTFSIGNSGKIFCPSIGEGTGSSKNIFYNTTTGEITFSDGGDASISLEYVDGSLAARDTSIAWLDANKLESVSFNDITDVSITDGSTHDILTPNISGEWVNQQKEWYVDSSLIQPVNTDYDVQLSSIEIVEDSGAVTLVDMAVTSTPTAGTEESYSFDIDGNAVTKIYSRADGSGGVEETANVLLADYQYIGPPGANGSWRFSVDSSENLLFEKRVAGTWTEGGKFIA